MIFASASLVLAASAALAASESFSKSVAGSLTAIASGQPPLRGTRLTHSRPVLVHRMAEVAGDVPLAPLLLFSILREASGDPQFPAADDDAARREGHP